MKKIILVAVFVLVAQVSLMAQGTAAFHVFPQIAVGLVGGGTYYDTTVVATNVNTQSATCTLRFYGVPISRLKASSPATVTLPAQGSVAIWETGGDGFPLASGYATLSCDRPVAGVALYSYSPPTNIPSSIATVFSSPPTMRAHLVAVESLHEHIALALANDTDNVGQYQVTVTDLSTGQIRSASVSVPARSNLPRFLNQIVQLPPEFFGTAVITSTSGPFSVVGLLYIDSIFTAVPATIY